MKKIILLAISVLFLFTSCAPQSKTGQGALIGAAGGAAAGALAGQLIGKNTKGTLIGAAVGAAVGSAAGAGIGHMMDKQEQELNQALAVSNAAAVRREGNLLAITLKGDVAFDSGSSKVNPGLYSEIDRIARVMTQYPQTRIRVEGHTDSKGSDQLNMDLSKRRAEAVKNLLVQNGVDPARITVMPFGETQPVAGNTTSQGRQRNRRVEIKIEPMSAG